MKITLKSAQALSVGADVVAIGVFALSSNSKDEKGSSKNAAEKSSKKDPKALPPFLKAVDEAIGNGGGLAKLIAKEEFTGKRDQVLSLPILANSIASRIVLIGLGERRAVGDAEVRAFAGKAARAANADKAKTLALYVPQGLETRLRYVAEGLVLGAYRFTKYLTGDRRPKAQIEEATVVLGTPARADAKRAVELGIRIADGVNLTRDLSNEPANVIFPASLAIAAQKMARENQLKCVVFDHKEILRRGMKLIDAVGRGSVNEPRFVHISYVPQRPKKRVVFVGKGITFDTGGISIKPAAGMGEMKHDMSGAANMVGFMAAIAALKPKVEVHAIMACAENMPDGNAYRPGDVWPSLDGKTVEIINTDAEGRLVLADALAYARNLKPDLMIDNATLTGACVVALGNTCSGFYATNDQTAELYAASAKTAGEQTWRMPLLEDLREQIKSEVADVKQTGERYGGSITAALFLREFIGDTKNWVHADIAGPVTADRPSGWTQAKGATGHGVLTFVSLVERLERAK